ncbi:MAG: hypothetical protein MJZ48_05015 [Paludibacteraceae bacterium]|nr:hypothetical protein [Paludibacteraceae bacterium]
MVKQKQDSHLNAQLLYVITIAWFVAAIGCFVKGIGSIAAIFATLGTIHLIWAIVVDVREGKTKE